MFRSGMMMAVLSSGIDWNRSRSVEAAPAGSVMISTDLGVTISFTSPEPSISFDPMTLSTFEIHSPDARLRRPHDRREPAGAPFRFDQGARRPPGQHQLRG